MTRRAFALVCALVAVGTVPSPALGAPAQPAAADGGFVPTPGGAELSVELDVQEPGTESSGGGSGDASPIRIEVVPLTSPEGTGAEHLCSPDPSTPDQLGWSYLVITFDATTGAELGREVVCVPVGSNGRPEPGPTIAPPTLLELWRAVGVPPPVIVTDPVIESVVGIDTEIAATSPTTIAVAINVRGYSVRGVAHLVEHRIDPGDGVARVAALDAGTSTSAYAYDTKGLHHVRATAVWRAEVTMTGPGLRGRATTVELGRALLRTTVDYRVVEVRSVLLP